MLFYERLEPLMAERKMSQKDLAAVAEVKPPSVSEWKTKGTLPRADTAIKIAEHFNVSIKWLVLGIEDAAFTRDERELLAVYRKLGQDDKVEIIGIIGLKLQSEAKKRGGALSDSETA